MVVVLGDGGGEVKVDGGREAERARAEPSVFAGCSTLLVGVNTKNVNIQQQIPEEEKTTTGT